ncbi:MAG: hypothetical protein ACLGIA_12220 [Actinomycetes bacterium]
MSILVDAGPALNFLAVGQQNVLLQVATSGGLQLAVPERVDREVDGKGAIGRFKRTAAVGTWRRLKSAGHITVLSDDLTTATFAAAVTRISGKPAQKRIADTRSLGEIMVLAHASTLVQAGTTVFVLIDETDGRRRCQREQQWLVGKGASGRLHMWSTGQVLKQANAGWFVGGHTWQQVYNQMRRFDDGLLPL